VSNSLARLLIASTTLLGCCALTPSASPPELCPVCRKPVADGPEVRVLRAGEREPGTRYRCFVCPIMQGEVGDVWTMRAVSGLDGRRVTFRVDHGRVISDPPTAVVLALEVGPGAECLDMHRVFADEDEFRRYVAAHPAVKDTRPRRIESVLAEHGR